MKFSYLRKDDGTLEECKLIAETPEDILALNGLRKVSEECGDLYWVFQHYLENDTNDPNELPLKFEVVL